MQTATFGVIKSMELAKFLEGMFASSLIGIYFIEVYQIHNKFLYVNQTRNCNRHTKRNVDSENYVNLEDCGYSFFDYKIAADTDFLIRALYKYELKVKYLKRYIVRMRVWEDFQLIAPNEKPYGMKILLYSSMDFDPFLQK